MRRCSYSALPKASIFAVSVACALVSSSHGPRKWIILALLSGERCHQVDELAERFLVDLKRLLRVRADVDGFVQIALDQLQESVLLAAIEPDDSGDILLLLGREVANRPGNLTEDLPRVQHQNVVAARRVGLLGAIKEPQLTGHGARVEEVAANIDHDIDRAGLDQLLAHCSLVAARTGRLRRHHHAGAARVVQIAVEVGQPEIIGVRDLLGLVDAGEAKGQALGITLDLLRVDLVDIERRIGPLRSRTCRPVRADPCSM